MARHDTSIASLERSWADRPGLVGWLTTVDHKRAGRRYIVTAFVFFALAGLLALAMRTQLMFPENKVLGPDRYDQVFSLHGSAMMFLFAVPVMEAVAIYIVPLMGGTRAISFPLLGAVHYWYPKITGRMMSERLGKIEFWLLFVGFIVTFFPMHYLGLAGMPRRVYTYLPGLGWDLPNLVSTLGSYTIAVAVLLFVFNALKSLRTGDPAPGDPWSASDLAWATPSPPPPYNFVRIPMVTSRHPLWADDVGTPATELPVVDGVRSDRRELLLTSPVDAVPSHRWGMPEATIWPLLAALAMTVLFIWSVFEEWGVVWGSIPVAITLTAWFWPKTHDEGEKGEG